MNPQETFHCQSNGVACGPYTRDDMASYLAGGQLNPADLVHDPASNSWMPIGQFLAIPTATFPPASTGPFPMLPALPGPMQPPQQNLMQPMMSAPQFAPIQPMPADDGSKNNNKWLAGSLGVLAAVIILIAIFTHTSKSEKLLKVHNSMASIERHFIQRTKSAINGVNNDTIEMSAAASEAASKLRDLDSTDCPDEYKIKLVQLADTFDKIAVSINQDDIDSFKSLTNERLSLARQLNLIAENNGVHFDFDH
jgi:hypothetical protein